MGAGNEISPHAPDHADLIVGRESLEIDRVQQCGFAQKARQELLAESPLDVVRLFEKTPFGEDIELECARVLLDLIDIELAKQSYEIIRRPFVHCVGQSKRTAGAVDA